MWRPGAKKIGHDADLVNALRGQRGDGVFEGRLREFEKADLDLRLRLARQHRRADAAEGLGVLGVAGAVAEQEDAFAAHA